VDEDGRIQLPRLPHSKNLDLLKLHTAAGSSVDEDGRIQLPRLPQSSNSTPIFAPAASWPRFLQSSNATSTLASSCHVPQDVIFVVDSSASIGKEEFNKTKTFLADIYQKLWIPPVRSGVIRFGVGMMSSHDVINALSYDKNALISSVQNMGYGEGETLMAPPLERAQNMFLSTGGFEHRTVVVITDGDPNDWQGTKQRVTAMRGDGIRLIFVMIGQAKAYLIEEMMSEPTNGSGVIDLIRVDSYSTLSSKILDLLKLLDPPCPCEEGLVGFIKIPANKCDVEDDVYSVALPEQVPHGQMASRQCPSGYSGVVNLTCTDAQLDVSHSCEPTCRPDNTEDLIVFDSERKYLRPFKEIASGGKEERLCKDEFSGTLGKIQLLCENGTLYAQHRCVQRCPTELSVNVSHDLQVADLQAPQSGLDGGTVFMHQCEDHFANTTGSIGLGCFDGELQASAQCSPRTQTECIQDPCTEGYPLWLLLVSIVCSAAVSASLTACWRKQVKCCGGTIVVPETVYVDQEMQTDQVHTTSTATSALSPLPPPEKSMHDKFTEPMAKNVGTDFALQTEPIMYAELMRGEQRPLDVVFVVDSSASVGEHDFQKATKFLLEVVHHFEMPGVRAGFIQFNDKVPFPDQAEVTGYRDQLEDKIKAMKYDVGETKMAPPLQAAAKMLEKVSNSLSPKLIVIVTDGDPGTGMYSLVDGVARYDEGEKWRPDGIQSSFQRFERLFDGDV
jgi:Mg-chelatase subunit ChlD